MPLRPVQFVAQALAYLAFTLVIGYLSAQPAYQHVEPGAAVVKLIFSHAPTRVAECRALTQEEIEALAPNMRMPMECPRERHAIFVELILDGGLLYSGSSQPIGLWKDGPATVYEKFIVTPGRHSLVMRLRDTGRVAGFDYEQSREIELQPQQNFVIGFRSTTGFRFFDG
jgi:hypothetical protein